MILHHPPHVAPAIGRLSSCPICKRVGPLTELGLCQACSEHPVLVRAFTEGRARQFEAAR
jgi:hypothetical protein